MRRRKKDFGSSRFPKEWLRGEYKPDEPKSENAVKNDRWDREDVARMRKEVAEFEASREKLGDFAPTGDRAHDDMFLSLYLTDPQLEDIDRMTPTTRVNRMVQELAWDLDEWESLRRYSRGDDAQAALATISMEPDLETIFDKTEQQRKAAKELEDAMKAAAQASQEQRDLDDLVREWMEDQDITECPECGGTGQVPDDDAEQGDDEGEDANAGGAGDDAEGEGEGEGPDGEGQGQGGEGAGQGQGQGEGQPGAGGQPGGSGGPTKECPTCHGEGHGHGNQFGPQQGGGKGKGKPQPGDGELTDEQKQQLDEFAKKQRELADKLMEAQAAAEQAEKDFDDELGTNRATIKETLANAMKQAAQDASSLNDTATAWGLEPGQLQKLNAQERMDLARRLNNERFKRVADLFGPMKNMMLTEQRRKTVNTREEIIDVEMGDDLSRILPIELLLLADEDAEWEFLRKFTEKSLVQYEMQGDEKLARGGIIMCEDGSGSMSGDRELWAKAVMLCLLHLSRIQKRSFRLIHFGSPGQTRLIEFTEPAHYTLDRILEAAELFFGGGTDFYTPMKQALGLLQDDHDRTGETRADIVFVTDDECYVDSDFMEEFLEESDRMDFTTWGISVTNGERRAGALDTMTRGKVAKIKDFGSGDDIRNIFRGV